MAMCNKKSNAKSLGLKSVIINKNDYVLVAFDNKKSNSIVRIEDAITKEQKIEPKDVPIQTLIEENIQIKKIVKSNVHEAFVDKPDVNRVGLDYLGLKDSIENYVFGKKYPTDNIHIQIAHNILDIKKILAPYVNDIVVSLSNITNTENDIIGSIYFLADRESQINDVTNTYYEKIKAKVKETDSFIEKLNPFVNFYGTVFKQLSDKDNPIEREQKLNYNFNVIRILGMVRQSIFHNKSLNENTVFGDQIYNIESYVPNDILTILTDTYRNDLNQMQNNFWRQQGTNFKILQKCFDAKDNEKLSLLLLTNLFNFVVKKDYKNLGISITKLRENIISQYMTEINENKFDSIRGKIYLIFDFIIYIYSLSLNLVNDTVDELRLCKNEIDKDIIYGKLAIKVWGYIGNILSKIPNYTNDIALHNRNKNIDNSYKEKLKNNLSINNTSNDFILLINYICKFLENKEINELVSEITNKFNNIADLIDIANSIPRFEKISFNDNFKMFNKSRVIASELRIVNSIARTKKTIQKQKSGDRIDALAPISYGVKILGLEEQFVKSDEFNEKSNKKDRNSTSIRNFIINNVLKSKQFKYVIKYIKPEDCSIFMKNKSLIKYIVQDLPDKQIERYCKILGYSNNDRNALCDRISDLFGYKKFRDVLISVKSKGKTQAEALVGLYLTIVYIFVKNMVKVNSAYTMAYYILERDYFLKYGNIQRINYYDLRLLNDYDYKIKTSNKKYVELNKKQYFEKEYEVLARQCRNKIVHFNVIVHIKDYINEIDFEGYYNAYHYCLQKCIVDSAKNRTDILIKINDNLVDFRSYSKDFNKLLFLPLAYNQSRYKNLTSEVLFNRYYGWNPQKDYRNI